MMGINDRYTLTRGRLCESLFTPGSSKKSREDRSKVVRTNFNVHCLLSNLRAPYWVVSPDLCITSTSNEKDSQAAICVGILGTCGPTLLMNQSGPHGEGYYFASRTDQRHDFADDICLPYDGHYDLKLCLRWPWQVKSNGNSLAPVNTPRRVVSSFDFCRYACASSLFLNRC